jgi:hypothetical protein
VVQGDGLFDDLAQLLEYRFLIAPMAAAIDQAWGTSDIALVFIRPLNDLRVLLLRIVTGSA